LQASTCRAGLALVYLRACRLKNPSCKHVTYAWQFNRKRVHAANHAVLPVFRFTRNFTSADWAHGKPSIVVGASPDEGSVLPDEGDVDDGDVGHVDEGDVGVVPDEGVDLRGDGGSAGETGGLHQGEAQRAWRRTALSLSGSGRAGEM
jgi:hypothetical protein